MEAGIVNIEATIVALKGAISWIQHNRSHKRSRAVSAGTKHVWHVRQRRNQGNKFTCPMCLGIRACKNGRIGGHGGGRLRIGLRKDQPLTSNSIQIASQAASRAEKAHSVHPRRIKCDKDNVRLGCSSGVDRKNKQD